MRGPVVFAGCLILFCGSAFGQEHSARFEVASVRPSAEATSTPANSGMQGGPGTADPERFTFRNLSVMALLLKAYGVQNYQISGPDWLASTRFNIEAKVPPGATEAQLNAILRDLLAERFNLTLHRETKAMAVYELTVAKNGPKLQDADMNAPPPPVREPGSRPPTVGLPDRAGFPQIPPGRPMMLGKMTNGIMRWTAKVQSLSNLISLLTGELDRPVVDKTGLTGKYDFTLAYSRVGLRQRGPAAAPDAAPADPSGGPTLLNAVQEQLGLKLESKKDGVDILMLDHIDKVRLRINQLLSCCRSQLRLRLLRQLREHELVGQADQSLDLGERQRVPSLQRHPVRSRRVGRRNDARTLDQLRELLHRAFER